MATASGKYRLKQNSTEATVICLFQNSFTSRSTVMTYSYAKRAGLNALGIGYCFKEKTDLVRQFVGTTQSG